MTGDKLASVTVPAKAGGKKLTVTASAFENGADIPFGNTQYQDNIFPGLSWARGPEGTKYYVLIVQDPGMTDPPERAATASGRGARIRCAPKVRELRN